jgi:hypothetical protein
MTGCDRILHRLQDGPATAAELYATTYTVVHSRIAELRRKGYWIDCDRVEGETGARSYLYRLVSGPVVSGEHGNRRLADQPSDGGPHGWHKEDVRTSSPGRHSPPPPVGALAPQSGAPSPPEQLTLQS